MLKHRAWSYELEKWVISRPSLRQHKTCSKFRGYLGDSGRARSALGARVPSSLGRRAWRDPSGLPSADKAVPQRLRLRRATWGLWRPPLRQEQKPAGSSRVSHHARNVASILCHVSVYVSSWGQGSVGPPRSASSPELVPRALSSRPRSWSPSPTLMNSASAALPSLPSRCRFRRGFRRAENNANSFGLFPSWICSKPVHQKLY